MIHHEKQIDRIAGGAAAVPGTQSILSGLLPDSDPPVISEQEQSETPGSPISRTSAPAQSEDPDLYDKEH